MQKNDLHSDIEPSSHFISKTFTKAHKLQEKPKVMSVYQLGPGDSIHITVYGEDSLSKAYTVSESGKISMLLVGDISVEGLTLSALRQELYERLSEGYIKDPDISLEMVHFRPVYILGEVNAPGSYQYIENMTVINAVATAGGYTYRADKDDIEIMRHKNGNAQTLKDLGDNDRVAPGDVIYVKERFF